MNSISVLVEAKKEYTNQLQQILTPRLYEGFKSIYEDIINLLSEEVIEKQMQNASIIKTFQKSLKDIPVWNNEMIKNEYSRIEKASNCDYLENLIEAVFISNTKILTSVQINSSNSMNIRINVPQPQHFIHKCYIECSKEIYKNPYIFDVSKNLTPKEKHTNLRETISLINHAVTNAIRDLLPIRDILRQGLINKSYEENNNIIEENNINNVINKTETNLNEIQLQENNFEEENQKNLSNENNSGDDKEEDSNKDYEEVESDGDVEDDVEDQVEVDEEEKDVDENKNIIIDENNIEPKSNDYNEEELRNKTDDEQIENENINLYKEDNNVIDNSFKNDINYNNEVTKIEETKLYPDENNSNYDRLQNNDEEHIKNIELNIKSNNEKKFLENNSNRIYSNDNSQNNLNEMKNIEIQKNSILKKLDNVEKVEKKEINELIVPVRRNETSYVKQINPNRFIKTKLNNKNNNFYEKKYNQNLANYNISNDNYSDDEKKVINLNNNNSDDDSDIDF